MITKFKKPKKPSPLKTLFLSIFLGLSFLLIIGFLVFSNWRISQRRAELAAEIAALQEEIRVLEEENQDLKTGITQTQGEDYWKEKLYEQGYVEKGEQQVVILPPEAEETEEKVEKNFWNPQSWWEWLKEKMRQ
ncbi:MAG: hypothetical protein AUJ31_02075 [Parcubacteria group bacterium CG1_02_39_15]|uniref:Septum formation initiator n=3 Tax=Candidatus Nealsoniibacteriota TaxID=1817911 RepID=A0A2G9YUB4_9BACT|nr:MAG: hypothetical protein AUJ31_02075 [Parcubacteria group bacterium CG1_02_39_15]PIP22323.1 MAG: hypothetical protein COX38_01210 [Candidatus Nealsonbacteria bacterium CG23_combo_of_CG06-09_8_20_14_all_39_25]PIW90479.1 MAG: hypothetical protein COZ92_00710 [Candidatus Nealsonbacteria bacterium CG_4_8_14_3_um_filter_40_11]PIZ88287.1 MAG: hypothetical protein COX91_00900 [Candidatus Nealsonbacteria bacterium CG_4_10_14_0_2_um_filter_39_15]